MTSSALRGVLSLRTWSATVGSAQSRITDLLVANLAHVLTLTGSVLLVVTGAPLAVLGAVSIMIGWGLVAWLLRRETARRESLLGRHLGGRTVLLIGVAAGWVHRRPDAVTPVVIATGVAVLVVLTEPTIRALLDKTGPVAVHLPGVRAVPAAPFAPGLVAVVSMIEILLGAVVAVAGLPGWLYLAIVVAGTLLALVLLAHVVRANLISRAALRGLRPALKRYGPAFVVYYAGTHGARYQLGMWLPYLERLEVPFVIITRSAETVPTITALTRAPVVVPRLASAQGSLDRLVVPSMKAAFYVQGSRSNLNFQRFRRLTHVWLNHGDSDKAANFSARHAGYDKVLVSGPQAVERYAAHGVTIPAQRLIMVGRPQVERIEVRDGPPGNAKPLTVLYAPTWRGGRPGTDYSSLALGDVIVAAMLERGWTVIFRPHPLSHTDPVDAGVIRTIQRRLESDRQRTQRPHRWGHAAERDLDVAGCINACDAVITDVSSVASDNLASGKPFAVVAIRAGDETFLQEFPIARVAYVIEKDLSTLATALDSLQGCDPLAEQRHAYRRHCLGDHLGPQAAEEFLRVAGRIVAGHR